MSIGRYVRLGTLKPCLEPSCQVLVVTKCNPKRCDRCRHALQQASEAAHRATLTQPHVCEPQPFQESPEAIEQAFQQALAQIKARPRPEPLVRWSSPLARL